MERAAVFKEDNGVTHVAVPLASTGSVFVVFRSPRGDVDPVVEVTRGGKPLVSATPTPPIEVTVTKARYGVLDDPQKTRDVTEKVQRKMDEGKYSFPVSSMADGDDPAFGA